MEEGGIHPFIGRLAAIHFSQEQPRVLKILDFFKNNVGPRVKESFWAYIDCLENGLSEAKIYKFFETKITNFDLFQNFVK